MTDSSSNSAVLADSFKSSRRTLNLLSGLLLIWEFVGVTVGEVPFENFNFNISNPEMAPIILLVLIVFQGYRMTLEWYQCNLQARQSLAARLDFYSSLAVAIISISVFAIQSIGSFQIADLMEPVSFVIVPGNFALGGILGWFAIDLWRIFFSDEKYLKFEYLKRIYKQYLILLPFALIAVIDIIYRPTDRSDIEIIALLVVGLLSVNVMRLMDMLVHFMNGIRRPK